MDTQLSEGLQLTYLSFMTRADFGIDEGDSHMGGVKPQSAPFKSKSAVMEKPSTKKHRPTEFKAFNRKGLSPNANPEDFGQEIFERIEAVLEPDVAGMTRKEMLRIQGQVLRRTIRSVGRDYPKHFIQHIAVVSNAVFDCNLFEAS